MRRDGKTLTLDGLTYDRTRHGTVRWFYRAPRRGKKQMRFADGSPVSGEPPLSITSAIMGAYEVAKAQLEAARPEQMNRGTLGWLFARYMEARRFDTELTRSAYRSVLKGIADKHGHRPFATMTPGHVNGLRDEVGGEAGNARVKKLRVIFDWAIGKEYMRSNPARGAKVLKIATRGHIPFTRADVLTYETRHPLGTKAHLAMALFLYSAARVSDVCSFGPMNDRDGRLIWIQHKGRTRKIVRRDLPLIAPLRAVLDVSSLGDKTWLETDYGQPFTIKGLGNKMRQWCDEARLFELSAHGFRKATGNIAAERGATAHEIMEILGVTLSVAELYTREADARKLADSGLGKAFGGDA